MPTEKALALLIRSGEFSESSRMVMLAECGEDRERFAAPQELQCVGGTAPVSFASGQMHQVRLRRACNKHLRAITHLWANLSRSCSAWAEAY